MISLTQQASDLFGLHLTPEQVASFGVYATELAAWNARINLTAITELEAVQVRHFLDSLSIIRAISPDEGLRIIDVGSGAGFPGLVLAIAFPEVHVMLLESTGKKVKFLDHVIEILGLTNVATVNARAEEAGHDSEFRTSYDLVLARAVARLPTLLEYMLPLARVGAKCVAMKGKTVEQEIRDSARALKILGGQLGEVIPVQLPEVDEIHYLVVVKKIRTTPESYPRGPGIPTRKPLE